MSHCVTGRNYNKCGET